MHHSSRMIIHKYMRVGHTIQWEEDSVGMDITAILVHRHVVVVEMLRDGGLVSS